MNVQVWISGFVGVAAIVDDLARRRISNWIPCTAFAAGLIFQSVQGGWRGAGSALVGTLVGGCVFLIFYLLGGMGGGDVKLMAGFGSVLGMQRILEAALWTAGCGGLMAALVIGFRFMRDFWKSRSAAAAQVAGANPAPELARRANSIPYAPAIAAGVWLSLVPKT